MGALFLFKIKISKGYTNLKQDVENRVKSLATEVCEREGFTLYDVEYLESKKVITIYIDKKGGVNLDDCEKVSLGVNFLLDVQDPIQSKYDLKVSSPGLEKKLTQKWHYKSQIGKEISIIIKARTRTAKFLKIKLLKGILKEVGKNSFKVESNKNLVECPYEDVHKCNAVFNFNLKSKMF